MKISFLARGTCVLLASPIIYMAAAQEGVGIDDTGLVNLDLDQTLSNITGISNLDNMLDDIGLGDFKLGGIVQSSVTALKALITALKTGSADENGLAGIVNLQQIQQQAKEASQNANTKAETQNISSPPATPANQQNGNVTTTAACPDMAVLFARGTAEAGNVGLLVGPAFNQALRTYMNGTDFAFQGVEYPATVKTFLVGGDATAGAAMARLAAATIAACPSTRLVLAGYSQGAQVTRLAAADASLPAASVSSIILFGDPANGQPIAGNRVDAARVRTFCHERDAICRGRRAVRPAHLDYSLDTPAAAMATMQLSGLGIASDDAIMQGMEGTVVGMAMSQMMASAQPKTGASMLESVLGIGGRVRVRLSRGLWEPSVRI